jgi:Protein of unknown function (DUF3303)
MRRRCIAGFEIKGRLAPEDLSYVASWVDDQLESAYQVMETDNRRLLEEWIANWSDLVDFEVIPVIDSQQAREKIGPEL